MPDEMKLEELQDTIDEARQRTGETRDPEQDDSQDFIDNGERDDPDHVDNAITPPG